LELPPLALPADWPAVLNGAPNVGSLALALACWWGVVHRHFAAVVVFASRMAAGHCNSAAPRRDPHTEHRPYHLHGGGVLAIDSPGLVLQRASAGKHCSVLWWAWPPAAGWSGPWRVIGNRRLAPRRRWASGDVTLMAMIRRLPRMATLSDHLLLAPFAGLVVGVLRLILFRDREIPYGPFLCLATLFVIVYWDAVWASTDEHVRLGVVVPLAVLCCLALMAVMLAIWRLILRRVSINEVPSPFGEG